MQFQEYFTLISWDVWSEIEHILIVIILIGIYVLVLHLTMLFHLLYLQWDSVRLLVFPDALSTWRAVFLPPLLHTAQMWAFKSTSFTYEICVFKKSWTWLLIKAKNNTYNRLRKISYWLSELNWFSLPVPAHQAVVFKKNSFRFQKC